MKFPVTPFFFALLCIPVLSCADRPTDDAKSDIVSFANELVDRYPKCEAKDLYKTLYQDEFGPGHIISSWANARAYLEREIASMPAHDEYGLVEPCGPSGRMLRLNLRTALAEGIGVDTIIALMKTSMERLQPDTLAFLQQWDAVRELAKQRKLPLTSAQIEEFDQTLGPDGLDVIHHSNVYMMNYAPAYRVILTSVYNEWKQRNGG